ncbi:MAG: D-alanyl-D-alanine carboxypeptidase, partial [Eubacteriales bacterium]|nr:D-alanyl-D-alanine carboxypeptidase [Eubacteriales bacterium]
LYTIFILNSSIFYIYAQEVNTEITSQDTQQDTSLDDPLSLIAETAVLIDAKTGIVLYDKDMNKKMYPASTTKILTALIALENSNPKDIIKHSHNAVYNIGPGSSNMGMKENEEIAMKDALYGVILKSANEVCMAIAEHISGDVDSFVNIMNERVKKIGANNTHFANPHGYHDENHYTTSYDMALIMKEAIKNEEFIKLISTKNYTVPKTNLSDEKLLTTSNKLILESSPFYYENCVGGKTGFTDQAGNTLVSYSKKDGIELIAVVMKSKGTEIYNDSKKLFEYGFNLHSEKSIFEKSNFKVTIPVEQIFKDKSISLGNVDLLAKNDVSLNLPNNIDLNKIEEKINLESTLIAPIKAGDTVGSIDLMYENNILASVDIVSDSEVNIIPEKKLERKEKIKKLMLLFIKIILGLLILIFIIIIAGFISRTYFKHK